MDLIPISKDYVVEKRNIVNEMKANGWTLQELRFFNLYLSKINARNKSTRLVRFTIETFGDLFGLKRTQAKDLKSTVNCLLSKTISIPIEPGNGIKKGYSTFQLFKECDIYETEDGTKYIEIDAHDKFLPLLFEFKEHYFNYSLWVILRLKSTNGFRMYEILKQYEYLGTRDISLADLRDLLGIEAKGYPQWRDFKRDVLDKCKATLSEITDIKYSYDPIRKGRGGKVVGIKFFIEKNEDYVDQLCFDEYIEPQEFYKEKSCPKQTSEDIKKTHPPKKSPSEKKKALDEAKKSDFWYYAIEKSKETIKQNPKIRATPENYAVGIIRNWNEAGYETIRDLKESGEISQQDIDNKPSFDLDLL